MTEVLCDVVECHSNSGGLRSTCTREVLRLDSEPEDGERVFVPGTAAMRCMDIDERGAIGSVEWAEDEVVKMKRGKQQNMKWREVES